MKKTGTKKAMAGVLNAAAEMVLKYNANSCCYSIVNQPEEPKTEWKKKK